MTLPASGNSISLNQVNVELGNSGTAAINMNSADVRGLFGVASGAIAMSDGFGKSSVAFFGSRGVFAGGIDSGDFTNIIQYITIATAGNATDFGDLTLARARLTAVSNGSRGVFAGGFAGGAKNVMDYITIASTGNATDFGDLLTSETGVCDAASMGDGTRGVIAGGNELGGGTIFIDVMQYITIASTGNATDFGNLLGAITDIAGTSNGPRGVAGAGYDSSASNVIQYITIATTGNATDFGDLTVARSAPVATSDGSRGVWASGYSGGRLDVIDYVTIATAGNATDFGNLLAVTNSGSATSNGPRGVFAGGATSSAPYNQNVIQYITIANTGNATDFGDLLQVNGGMGGTSGE